MIRSSKIVFSSCSLRHIAWRNQNLIRTYNIRLFSNSNGLKQVNVVKSENGGNRDTMKRLLKLAVPEKKLILASMGTLVITSSISLVFPMAIGKILDMSLNDGDGIPLQFLAGGLLSLFVVQGGLIVGRSAMLSVAGERLIARLRKDLFKSALSQDMGFFDQTRTGELINRLAADSQLVQKSVTGNVVTGLRNVFMAVGGTAMLLYTSPMLALVSLSVIPPVGFVARYFGRFVKKQQKEVQDALAHTSTVAEEVFSNVRTVRQFAAEPYEIAKYDARIDTAYSKACRVALTSAWFEGTTHLAANFSLIAVLGYGGSLVISHEITAGALTSFLLYSLYVGINVTNLSTVYSELMKGVGASSRIFDIIDRVPTMPSSVTSSALNIAGASSDANKLPRFIRTAIYQESFSDDSTPSLGMRMFGIHTPTSEAEYMAPYGTTSKTDAGYVSLIPEASKLQTPQISGAISFRNVEFGYPSRPDVGVLHGVSLDVTCGESVALVGASGSGKTTLGQLLTRMYDPISGSITIDGLDIRSIDPHWLRRHIGVVAQEPMLFSGTIEENILYGNPHASHEAVMEAAEAARVLQFAEKLPDHLDTRVGERGIALSGGQKQRVALARVFLKNPPIVLLDEATSALDAESEFHVQQAIEKIMKGRTVVSIAHRLSSMKNSNKIAVLELGKVIETGTYIDLLKRKGAFEQLIHRQL